MLYGKVNDRPEARVTLRVRRDSQKAVLDLDAVIDTGYTGMLTLSDKLIADLGLVPMRFTRTVRLADGSVKMVGAYFVEVLLGAEWEKVLVTPNGTEPLVGLKLFDKHRLQIDVVPDGAVEVTTIK